jgi:integrase
LWLNNHPLKGDNNPLFNDRRFRLQPLGQDGVQKVLQTLTKRAGISKHVHPHLLRHSRLTQLAKDFTESELKIMAGWTGDSRMAGIYVHLSGADIERKQLERAGLIDKEERQKEENLLKPRDCPRCKEVNPATAKFCYKCGMALDIQTAMKVEEKDSGMMMDFIELLKREPRLFEIMKGISDK